MSAAEDVALIQHFYAARGDRTVFEEVMAPDVVWDITPGFPNGGTYDGLAAVLGDFLPGAARGLASLGAVPGDYIADAQGRVVVLGHYAATTADGRNAEIRFTHTWTVRDGAIVRLDQTADSLVLHHLLSA